MGLNNSYRNPWAWQLKNTFHGKLTSSILITLVSSSDVADTYGSVRESAADESSQGLWVHMVNIGGICRHFPQGFGAERKWGHAQIPGTPVSFLLRVSSGFSPWPMICLRSVWAEAPLKTKIWGGNARVWRAPSWKKKYGNIYRFLHAADTGSTPIHP